MTREEQAEQRNLQIKATRENEQGVQVAKMVKHGLSIGDANLAFDIAWHAQEEAQRTLIRVCERAPVIDQYALALGVLYLRKAMEQAEKEMMRRAFAAQAPTDVQELVKRSLDQLLGDKEQPKT